MTARMRYLFTLFLFVFLLATTIEANLLKKIFTSKKKEGDYQHLDRLLKEIKELFGQAQVNIHVFGETTGQIMGLAFGNAANNCTTLMSLADSYDNLKGKMEGQFKNIEEKALEMRSILESSTQMKGEDKLIYVSLFNMQGQTYENLKQEIRNRDLNDTAFHRLEVVLSRCPHF